MNTQQYGHLNRGAFHAGLVELRKALKTLVEQQIGHKAICHAKHTSETWKHQIAAVSTARLITAYLNVYLYVRGKTQAHNPNKYNAAEYQYDRDFAQTTFDNAVAKYEEQLAEAEKVVEQVV